MEKSTLALEEIYLLRGELLGSVNPNTNEVISKGLASEKLGIVTKYWLTELAKFADKEKVKIDEIRNEMIKKYGEEKDGLVSIPSFVEEGDDKVVNPNFKSFSDEFKELLSQMKEVSHFKFTLDHFITKADPNGIEIDGNYPVFYSLISVNKEV
jgi:hypothetical protein